MKDILRSKSFWILVIVVILIYVMYHLGVESSKPWTKGKEKDAISGCNKWGGEIVRDSNGEYIGCSINGRLDE